MRVVSFYGMPLIEKEGFLALPYLVRLNNHGGQAVMV
jgi:hypothetical protein